MIPTTMKAARFDRFGEPSEVTDCIEVPVPQPGPGEVQIQVEALPLHIADRKFIAQELPFYAPLPASPGQEGIGRVTALGPGVSRFHEGDRVFVGMRSQSARQYMTMPEDEIWGAPEGDALQLSLLPINPPTSWFLLRSVVPVNPGEWVVQNAGNSSCGRYLIVLAKRWGIRTISIVRRPELVDELKALGGDHVLVDGPNIVDEIREIMGDQPARLGIDAIAGEASLTLAKVLAEEGTIAVYGMLSGQPSAIPPDMLFGKGLTLHGFLTSRPLVRMSDGEREAMFTELANLVADGTLSAKIAAVYELDQIKDALAHAGRTGADRLGKIIVTPNRVPA